MAYTVLARKYRSQIFDEVIGQEPIAKTLQNAIKTHRVAHAYLLSGTRGVGKTTMARILAKALNCQSSDGPTTEPCCKCESCIAVNSGEDIDVIEIDGASNNGVEEVRRLRENAIYRPARCRYKIYIIDEVHMLTTNAFNALLKTLEEPPDHVKFIFATTEPNKVIPTIQSRCQRFDFNNISAKLIAGQLKSILKKEGIEYEEDIILPLARMANGSMRDGLSLLDRLISTGEHPLTASMLEEYLGQPNSEKLCNLVEKIADSDPGETLQAAQELINTGLSEVQIVDALVDYMRDLMVVKSAGVASELLALTEQQKKRLEKLADKFDVAGLVYNITALEKLRWSIKNSETGRALLDAALLRFALSEHFLNVDELISRPASQPKRGSGIKKKSITNSRPQQPSKAVQSSQAKAASVSFQINDVESAKNQWKEMLKLISRKLSNGTAALLSSAEPKEFQEGLLTLRFPGNGQMAKQMCESNGKKEQLESIFTESAGGQVRLNFEVAKDAGESSGKTPGKLREEIIQHPAVKTIITELGATITGIEEDI